MQTQQTRRTAANVRAELARAGLSQREVCARLHLSRTAVSNRLQGHTDFRLQELRTISDMLGTTVGALIGETLGGSDPALHHSPALASGDPHDQKAAS